MSKEWESKHENKHAKAEEHKVEKVSDKSIEVTPLAAPTPGTTITAATTIDAIFTAVYGTRSSDLSATPTYSWGTGNQIIAQWPGVTQNNVINNSAIWATFNARSMGTSSITQ